jgi:hypothetical protein
MSKYIMADQLAAMLGIDEEAVYEMARLRSLPFLVTTKSPRTLAIAERDFNQWRLAVLDQEP